MADEKREPLIGIVDDWPKLELKLEQMLAAAAEGSPMYFNVLTCYLLAKIGFELRSINESVHRVWSDTNPMKLAITGYSIGEGVNRDKVPGIQDLLEEMQSDLATMRAAILSGRANIR